MYRSVGTNNLKRHPLTFSIILTLIAGMVLCAVPVQGISAQTSFFMQSEQPLYSARTADHRSGYAAQYSAVLKALAGGANPEFGSVGGEWKVLALARSGFYPTQSGYFSEYYAKIEKLVAANGSPKLHPQKSTENSRLIIALSSIGRDARSVAGFDLTAPLGDFNYVKKQGLNGVIFALIALDCNKDYGMSDIKSQCVDLLLSRECDGGGWALGLGAAEADITAMAITALAPYRKAAAAIERGVEKLSALQNANGSFSSGGVETSESCSQVLVALSTVGINAHKDSRFIKSGNSALDALCAFYVGGGFAHMANGGANSMATEQAAYALCAYDRFLSGRSSLYNMNDVSPVSPAEPTDKPTPKPTGKPTAAPTDAAPSDAASSDAAYSTAPATDTAATDAAYTDAPATDAVPTDTSAASTSPNLPSFEPDATAEIETADAVSPRESASAQGSDRTKSGSRVFDVFIAAAAVCLLGTAAYFVIKKRNRRQ